MHLKLKIIKVVFFIGKVTRMQLERLKLTNSLLEIKTGTLISFYWQMWTNMIRTIEIQKRWVSKRFLWWRKTRFLLKISKTERRLVWGKKQPLGWKGRDTQRTSQMNGLTKAHKLSILFPTIKISSRSSRMFQKQRKFRWITTNTWLKTNRKRRGSTMRRMKRSQSHTCTDRECSKQHNARFWRQARS